MTESSIAEGGVNIESATAATCSGSNVKNCNVTQSKKHSAFVICTGYTVLHIVLHIWKYGITHLEVFAQVLHSIVLHIWKYLHRLYSVTHCITHLEVW